MTDERDPLKGIPLTNDEEAFYAALAERAEGGDDLHTASSGVALEGDDAAHAGRSLLESIIGAEKLDQAIAHGGRPPLDGSLGAGESPTRRFRLPRELDTALTDRAAAEHRRPSAIIRDALSDYLRRQAS